jgi:hypothetical protein
MPRGRAVEAKGPGGAPGDLAKPIVVLGGHVGCWNGGCPLTALSRTSTGGVARVVERKFKADVTVLNFMAAEKDRSFAYIVREYDRGKIE